MSEGVGSSRHPARPPVGRRALAVLPVAAVALALAAALAPGAALAADPTPAPTLASCDDLWPEEGPAGVDLRLGCNVQRLISHYTGQEVSDEPARATAYLPVLGGAVLLAAALLFVVRWGWRRANRRLAPALPGSWWACPACRSVNGEARTTCYSCGAPMPADALALPTAEHPETRQAFGGTRKPGGP